MLTVFKLPQTLDPRVALAPCIMHYVYTLCHQYSYFIPSVEMLRLMPQALDSCDYARNPVLIKNKFLALHIEKKIFRMGLLKLQNSKYHKKSTKYSAY